jgi:hypothetical protein
MHTGHTDPVEPVITSLFETQTVEDAIKKAKELAKNVRPGNQTKGKSDQYVADGGYEEAVRILKETGATNIHPERIMGGDALIGDLQNGTIVAREKSTEGSPTLEVQDKTNQNKKKYTKIRFEDPNEIMVEK